MSPWERDARDRVAELDRTPGWRESPVLPTVQALASALEEIDRLRAELQRRGLYTDDGGPK